LLRHLRPPRSATPNFPAPEQAKALAVPADHGGGLDEEDTGPPIVPDGAEPSPQQSIRRGEFRTLDGALQNTELVAERQDFQLQRRTAPEGGENRGEERRKEGAEREPKEEHQTPTYQLHRNLRESQSMTLRSRRLKTQPDPGARRPAAVEQRADSPLLKNLMTMGSSLQIPF
jgi:hypothetical protein